MFSNSHKKMNYGFKEPVLPAPKVVPKHPPGYYLRVVLGIFAALVVVAIAVSAIIAMVYSSNANATQRYCVESDSFLGAITTDINDRDIAWNLQYANDMGTIESLYIMGPIPNGLSDGPIYVALCGSPSELACDLTVSNELKGRIEELNPGGIGLKKFIHAIRQEPWRYYIQLTGSTKVTRDGFMQICGTQ